MPSSSAKVLPHARELRARITAAKMTFAEFGQLVGLSRNQLYKLLTVQQPSPDLRKRIDQVLSSRAKRA